MKDYGNLYPLVEWGMTESDCLAYCHDHGIYWKEDGVELYSIYRRVSCWCCRYTGLGELRNMYHHQPKYWGWLKGLQSKMPEYPFRLDGKSVFDLEERFRKEDEQMELFDDGKVVPNSQKERKKRVYRKPVHFCITYKVEGEVEFDVMACSKAEALEKAQALIDECGGLDEMSWAEQSWSDDISARLDHLRNHEDGLDFAVPNRIRKRIEEDS